MQLNIPVDCNFVGVVHNPSTSSSSALKRTENDIFSKVKYDLYFFVKTLKLNKKTSKSYIIAHRYFTTCLRNINYKQKIIIIFYDLLQWNNR